VSWQKEIAAGHHAGQASGASSALKIRRRVAGFTVAAALSVLFWLAIIGGITWMM
jgi:uncharacterized membrane protein YgaE (UPF0421/DUF939 family)